MNFGPLCRWRKVVPSEKPYRALLRNAAAFVELLQGRTVEQKVLEKRFTLWQKQQQQQQQQQSPQQQQQQQQQGKNTSMNHMLFKAAAANEGGSLLEVDMSSWGRTVLLETEHKVLFQRDNEVRLYGISGRSDLILEHHTRAQQQHQSASTPPPPAAAAGGGWAGRHANSGGIVLPPTIRHLIEIKCPTHPRSDVDPLWEKQALAYSVLCRKHIHLVSVVDMAAGRVYTRLVQPPDYIAARAAAAAAAAATGAMAVPAAAGAAASPAAAVSAPAALAAASGHGIGVAAGGLDGRELSTSRRIPVGPRFIEPVGMNCLERMTAASNIVREYGWSEQLMKTLRGLMIGVAEVADREDGVEGGLLNGSKSINNVSQGRVR